MSKDSTRSMPCAPPNKDSAQSESHGFTRRSFLKGLGTAGIGTLALQPTGLIKAEELTTETAVAAATEAAPVLNGIISIKLKINGEVKEAKVETRTTLLDALRNHLDLTGSKLVCDRGTCGACTVHLDGKPVTSCMVLAIDAQDHEIRTIEGLAKGDQLHPVQQAFVEHDALQCGFCTPGMVMACTAVLEKNPAATMEEIKEGISGNICRCGTYNNIFAAAERARELLKSGTVKTAEATS